MTRQRRLIVEELARTRSHPTAEELHTRLRHRIPRLSLGTVYRNLELLVTAGSIGRLSDGKGRMHFDARPESHAHVRCEVCGRIEDVPAGVLPELGEGVARRTGYRLSGHSLVFFGQCPQCSGKTGRQDERVRVVRKTRGPGGSTGPGSRR